MAVQAVTADNVWEFRGLSSDEKPGATDGKYKGIKIGTGSIFFEVDTTEVYFFNSDADGTPGNPYWIKC